MLGIIANFRLLKPNIRIFSNKLKFCSNIMKIKTKSICQSTVHLSNNYKVLETLHKILETKSSCLMHHVLCIRIHKEGAQLMKRKTFLFTLILLNSFIYEGRKQFYFIIWLQKVGSRHNLLTTNTYSTQL